MKPTTSPWKDYYAPYACVCVCVCVKACVGVWNDRVYEHSESGQDNNSNCMFRILGQGDVNLGLVLLHSQQCISEANNQA